MVALYLDSGDLGEIEKYASEVAGVTTNPSLMKKAGIRRYSDFAKAVLSLIGGKPVSFEVFADDVEGIQQQGETIASWGDNIWVKVPVVSTSGISNHRIIRSLGRQGIKVNVTAVMTRSQLGILGSDMWRNTPSIISIFAGRIADTLENPEPIFSYGKMRCGYLKKCQFLWASTREIYNVRHAEACGADIITMAPDILRKIPLNGKNLEQYSIDTVKQFYEDSKGIEF